MIKIDRTRIAPPPEFLDIAHEDEIGAKQFYDDPVNIRYGDFNFKAYHSRAARESLLELFYDKCAYCESKLGVSAELEIDRFRPTAMAVNHDGSIDKPGYWWLAWEWSNLYPACPTCNRTKASRFPVDGRRAEYIEAGSLHNATNPTEIPLRAVSVYAEGRSTLMLSENGALDIYDLGTARTTFTTPTEMEKPSFVDVSSDGKTAALASPDGQWAVWNLSSRSARPRGEILTTDERIRDLAISPDGQLVALAVGTNLQVWDIQERVMIHQMEGHADYVNALAISPDGRVVISAAEDTTLGVWDLDSGKKLHILRKHERPVYGVGISADGNRIVSLSAYGTLRVWDLKSGEQHFEIEGDGFGYESLSISADGRFAICKKQRAVRVMDLHTRQERLKIIQNGEISDAAVTPDGRYVLTAGSDGALEIWNLFSEGAERALILDPCQNNPENHLVFRKNGQVASIPADSRDIHSMDRERSPDFDRGQITIDTFGLNRTELVKERQQAADQLRAQVREALAGIDMNDPDNEEVIQEKVSELLSPRYAYSAMRRQLLPVFIDRIRDELQDIEKVMMPESVEQKIEQYAVESEVFDQAFEQLDQMTSQRVATDIEDVEKSDIYLRSVMISRVEIKNFRCLDHISFDFGGGSGNRVGWKVLLGENGAGKSSVLQAVALAMMGRDRLEKLYDVKQKSILKRGEDEGYVKIYFSTETQPIELRITPDGLEYPSTESTLRTYMLGFGSARWLPREGSDEPESGKYVRIRNLFNPFVPLTNALQWLADFKTESLKDRTKIREYQKVEAVLARLLILEPETRFPLRDGILYIQRPNQTFAHWDRLDQLSDGHQTILAIAVAIMEMLGELWQWELELAEGLVLLDEIGSHLHPRWKLRIVESLRSAFPRMQFIATTHEPLCLRGLVDGEIIVMRKNANREVVAITDLPSVEGLRVDQLLTSEHFGLLTTRSYDTEEMFTEYYDLLLKKEITQDEQIRLDELKEELQKLKLMGVTRRERLMLEAIDRYLAQEPIFLGTPEEASEREALENNLDNLAAGRE